MGQSRNPIIYRAFTGGIRAETEFELGRGGKGCEWRTVKYSFQESDFPSQVHPK